MGSVPSEGPRCLSLAIASWGYQATAEKAVSAGFVPWSTSPAMGGLWWTGGMWTGADSPPQQASFQAAQILAES